MTWCTRRERVMLATGKCMYVMAKLTCAWWRIGRSLPSSGSSSRWWSKFNLLSPLNQSRRFHFYLHLKCNLRASLAWQEVAFFLYWNCSVKTWVRWVKWKKSESLLRAKEFNIKARSEELLVEASGKSGSRSLLLFFPLGEASKRSSGTVIIMSQ